MGSEEAIGERGERRRGGQIWEGVKTIDRLEEGTAVGGKLSGRDDAHGQRRAAEGPPRLLLQTVPAMPGSWKWGRKEIFNFYNSRQASRQAGRPLFSSSLSGSWTDGRAEGRSRFTCWRCRCCSQRRRIAARAERLRRIHSYTDCTTVSQSGRQTDPH